MLGKASSILLLLASLKISYGASIPFSEGTPLPLVIWHGLGDNHKADGLKSVGELAKKVNPGTFVYYVHLDEDPGHDRSATYFGNLTEQIALVCKDLASHPILSTSPDGINALGFSQGGQFFRGFIERCNIPRVRTFVTFGSQHNGISEFRKCGDTDWLCKAAFGLLRGNVWSPFVQSKLVPAQYFRDPEDLDAYLENSNFLADINNERQLKNTKYARNLASLDQFATYMFTEDAEVIPPESAWFAEVNQTTGVVTPLQERNIWKEDWIGLKALAEKGGLEMGLIEGGHMQLTEEFLTMAFKRHFGPLKKEMFQVEL